MPMMMSLKDAAEAARGSAAQPIPSGDSAALAELLKSHKISSDEFQKIKQIKGATPSLTELGVFSAMWSEHCSYKSSRVHLKRFPTTGANVVVGPGENAGVVRLEGSICLAFKMESHNHPSYIEPYQGAATGVGGILRDVFCMGARPFANLNCLRFGEREHPRTPYLVPRVVKGIGDYGNCVGVPTVGGSVSYDKSYNGNCLVNAMTVGLIRDDKIFKGYATGVGNLGVYVGSATGRDGIHGATMASDSFAASTDNSKTTVQVGDPFAEKLLLEATLEVLEKNLVVGIQDMGAAGLTSSAFEMAGRAGNGVYLNLDFVPVRAKQMTAYEIMLSESQERMLMVVEPGKWDSLKEVLEKWRLAHAIIGVVTDSGRMLISSRGILEINLPVAPLTDDAPVYNKPMTSRVERVRASEALESLEANLNSNLDLARKTAVGALKDTGSKQKIYEQFDRHIGARTVMGPDHGGAAVMWIRTEETKNAPYLGVAIAAGCNERRVKNTPLIGAAEAVLSQVRQIFAAGGKPLAVTDCLNFGSADDPDVMREFSDSVDGISRACEELGIPVVSGNVSLYNSTDGVSIYPTPMIGVVGRVDDIRRVTPARLIDAKDLSLYIMSSSVGTVSKPSFVASLAAKFNNIPATEGLLDEISWGQELGAGRCLEELRGADLLKAARDVHVGGAGITVLKMTADLLGEKPSLDLRFSGSLEFFGEGGPRYILALDKSQAKMAEVIVTRHSMKLSLAAQLTFDQSNEVKTYFGTIPATEFSRAFKSSQPIGNY